MLLTVDVGNTQTLLGLFREQELARHWRLATEPQRTADELAVLLESLLRLGGEGLEQIHAFALSSVVPRLDREYVSMCTRYLGTQPLVVGPGVKTGMPILTKNPREVGSDLIVDAVAGYELYGGPCIVVDFGTATTFSAVSERGEYLGTAIAPGVEVSLDALTSRAAKLSKVELLQPTAVIGKTTAESLRAGVFYGFAGQVDGIVTRMREELGADAVTVATGGLAGLLFAYARTLDHYDPFLTLRGLEMVYRRNEESGHGG